MILQTRHLTTRITLTEAQVFVTDLLPFVNSSKQRHAEPRTAERCGLARRTVPLLLGALRENTAVRVAAPPTPRTSKEDGKTELCPKEHWTNGDLKITLLSSKDTSRHLMLCCVTFDKVSLL